MGAKFETLVALTILVAGCGGYESRYEAGVHDYEPVYCYRNLGDISCYDTPEHRDERQLVNYYGPAPGRYDRPEPPPKPRLDPPPVANYYVRDAEPIPRPAPHGPLDDRPWLGSDFQPTPEARPYGPLGDRPWLPPEYRQGAPRSADPGGFADRPWLAPGYQPQSGPNEDNGDAAAAESPGPVAGDEAPVD
jgi:hypothetical protein